MPTDAVLRELLVRHLETWLPGALHRARRATLALAYAGGDGGCAEAALRVVARHADRLRGRQLTVLVLADGGEELPARLGAVEAELPAGVAVHLVPGGPARLPVAVKAAGAAGAPLLSVVDDDAAGAAVLTAAAAGKPADVLLATAAGTPARAALADAGFPLTTEVELAPLDGTPTRLLAFATGSDKSLEAFKEALWTLDGVAGMRYRDPVGRLLDVVPAPQTGPLRDELLAELTRSGPRTVTELRRHALTETAYRSSDAARALVELLDAGEAARAPEHGRLGGDVVISARDAGPVR
ncbi:hypothetical protein V6U77_08305 [Micromonospora sp. CPCC 205546]|uniref:hypothetical protein n=1 Tax=Micromonospora sp. CPCC 205546 TaxID=3122397 RepID=UPI002FF2DAC5